MAVFVTPLNPLHRAAGARMVEFAGWEMPVYCTGIVAEHRAVRRQAGIFDVSHMGRLELTGPQALGLLQWLFTTDIAALRDDQGQYTVLCHLAGGILDDCVLYRRDEGRFLLVCNASNRPKLLSWTGGWQRRYPGARLADQTRGSAMIAVQGPAAPGLVADVLGPGLLALPRFHLGQGFFQGKPVLAARTGYTGEDGFELVCDSAQAPALWQDLVARGATPCGLGARDTLRLEAALHLYGNDMDESRDPFSAGLGRLVHLDKGPFLGRDALVRLQAQGPAERLVGLRMLGREIARHGYLILDGGRRAGVVTSGSHAPWLECNIALGYVESRLAEPGTRLQIDVRGRRAEAVVVPRPFYRRGAPGGHSRPEETTQRES
ncbi:MAG: glycine cleavage system aminomethyltransferase GcvT [Chloroflexi bacterium]|nr:glycine cleavage system aminomethyltransferase GcvT [Chloroflexota bacterium]